MRYALNKSMRIGKKKNKKTQAEDLESNLSEQKAEKNCETPFNASLSLTKGNEHAEIFTEFPCC